MNVTHLSHKFLI